MTVHDYKQNRQAIRDLSQGKETDAVKEFLKRYEIRPRENKEQSKNEKETETMAKKQKQNPPILTTKAFADCALRTINQNFQLQGITFALGKKQINLHCPRLFVSLTSS